MMTDLEIAADLCLRSCMSITNASMNPESFRFTVPTLEGSTFTLRPISVSDAGSMVPWLQDLQTTESFLSYDPPRSAELEEKWVEEVERMQGRTAAIFGIASKETTKLIGTASLKSIDWRNSSACIGLLIGDKSRVGTTLSTELVKILSYLAIELLHLERVYFEALGSDASVAVAEQTGFKPEGRLRNAAFVNGKHYDVVVYSLLKSEYFEKSKQPIAQYATS